MSTNDPIFMTSQTVSYEVRGEVAVLTMDRPPVNSLGYALRAGIVAAIDRATIDPSVRAIVLTGTARAFSGGADITEFNTPEATRGPRLAQVIRSVEDSPKPVVAAIAGVCLGGGFELALGAHFRVASLDARLGLPEVKLGLLPGAGGTQRLPRLIGLEPALNLILSGESVPVGALAQQGLIHRVAEGDLLEAALAYAGEVMAQGRAAVRARELKIKDPLADAFLAFARNNVAAGKDLALLPARLKCVEAVAAGVQKPFEDGIQLEREAFMHLMQTPESRALRHIFQAERAASKVAGLPVDLPRRAVHKVGVIGAGTMGGGIAMTLANAGLPVVLLEQGQDALDKGLATIRRNYEASLAKGKLTGDQLEQRLALIAPTLGYGALRDCDLVIEAVFESMEVKEQVFRTLDEVCRKGAILASNTSALDLNRIAAFTRRPQDVIGLHFFSPANVMRLLEVVRGAQTAPDVLATCMDLARKIGKIAVMSGVCDGFIGTRMIARYGAAANRLLVQGALPQQVDGALQKFGLAMGPFRMGDLAGLDIGYAGRMRRKAASSEPYVRVVADDLVEAGRHGQKTGAGWYRYEAGNRNPVPDPAVEDLIVRYRGQHGIVPRRISDDEVVERCIYALVNEGARILEEGIAAKASDIDVVYLNGYGFPRRRGGPMLYADSVGLPRVVRALQRFAAEPGAEPWWQPAPLLVALAADGKTFTGAR